MAAAMKDWNHFLKCFHDRVDRRGTDECWKWTGGPTSQGYGACSFNRKKLYAHRVAWELVNGEIPDGMFVCHRCDVPLCCNPAHLFLGTQADNLADMDRKGRRRSSRLRGEGHPRTKFSDKLVAEVRAAYRRGEGSQKRLAERFGISKGYITQLLRGDFRASQPQ